MEQRPGYAYAADFFDFVDASSGRSAARFLERISPELRPRSVLDVGCGRGVWLRAWSDRGVEQLLGVDGAYVDPARLHVSRDRFVPADIARPLDLGRRFDLVECLEVAEHVAAEAAETLLANLVRHGDVILFSSATPGQGGEWHVNEQPISYWVERFSALGFAAFDYPRSVVQADREIEPWYRYNTLLYANRAGEERLTPAVRATRLAPGQRPPDVSPLSWRARCAFFRALPNPVVHRLARLKHRLVRHP